MTFVFQLRLDFSTFVISGPYTATTSTIKILSGAVAASGQAATYGSQCK